MSHLLELWFTTGHNIAFSPPTEDSALLLIVDWSYSSKVKAKAFGEVSSSVVKCNIKQNHKVA